LKKALVLIVVILLASTALADDVVNFLTTESVEAKKGTSFPVKVNLKNQDQLVAMQVPIYYRSEDVDLVCDSISFVDTRLADQSLSFYRIEPVGKVAFFAFMAMTQLDPTKPELLPGDGTVAVMWFTAGKDIKSGTVTLESGPQAYFPHEWIDYSYHFWINPSPEESTQDVECKYTAGTIKIK